MTNREREFDKPATQLKQLTETVAVDIWLDRLDPSTLKAFHNPWALYELASKTQFRDTESIIDYIAHELDTCQTCQDCCIELVRAREHMPVEIFKQDDCCLLEWKQEMRAQHDYSEDIGPQLDYTISLLKPGHHPDAEDMLRQTLGSDAIVAIKDIRLTEQDIAFLYTSAYGDAFIKDLIDYMTSGEVRALLLYKPDIGKDHNLVKKGIREMLLTTDPLRNNVHFPDSFHESLAQATYFFPEESKLYVVS